MKRRISAVLRLLLTLVVSGVCLYFAARRIELDALRSEIGNLTWFFSAPAVLASVAALSLRSLRWHLVLVREKNFAFSNTYWANGMGYLGNNILPARAGELIRSVVLALSTGIRKSMVLATALTERMLDAGILLALAFIMLQFTEALPPSVQSIWSLMLPLVLGLLAVAFAAPLLQVFWLRVLGALPMPEALRQKLRHLLLGLLDGIRVFHHLRLLIVFLLLTCVIWVVDAAVFVFLARAFGAQLTLPQAVVFSAALGFASSIPSTPGFVGVFQAVAVLVLPVFAVSANKAFLIVSLFQVMFLLITVLIGGYGWLVMRRRIGHAKLKEELQSESQT
ncbi:MAG TPA: lysylphosphatidylglycerol synthase transmembrane domain-containing protein [Turneriella sp.]|nr:lysylphosphatidylglycerol synthase transmembrane domain-containing protein [Turneriella sp.]HNA79030.1 lysylphosphatidylglycerol synthase transmembrane domain-containing protein [Turneriella sp.]HNE19909.1 lysylphosphatidylglycerol synthase transmembrane domain-containing protein [Turneriella sp.]HNL10237.1 lysylphosphatidylglycerol synthase transmembrane domain-containing protein [Turneriella sp.]HNL54681.1 lysylphosphatidylglycerol synthase transmembrane domain-containing protein [Turnerie